MAWVFLLLAGIFEVGWPIGLKLAQHSGTRLIGICLALFFIMLSGYLLFLAQKHIPMGTAYAIWTSIGAVGAFLVGLIFYGDAASMARWMGVLLIISGVIVLKVSS